MVGCHLRGLPVIHLVPATGLEWQGCGFSSLPWLQQHGERQWVEQEPRRHFAIKWCNLVSARCFDFAQLCLCAFRLILLAGRSRAACCLSRVLVRFLLDMQLSWRGTLQPHSLLWLGSFKSIWESERRAAEGRLLSSFRLSEAGGKRGQCLRHPESPNVWPSYFDREETGQFMCVGLCYCLAGIATPPHCVLVSCKGQKKRNSSSL